MHSRLSALQADALLSWLHRLKLWSGVRELHPCFRAGDPGYCSYTNSAHGASSESRTRVIGLEARGTSRYTMLAMAGDEGLEPSYLDLETSVLAAGRISRKLMAELTGVEAVPADRQSAILPIDHSSGSLPWTRTTISAFRAQSSCHWTKREFQLSKNWLPGSDSNARTRIQSPGSCH